MESKERTHNNPDASSSENEYHLQEQSEQGMQLIFDQELHYEMEEHLVDPKAVEEAECFKSEEGQRFIVEDQAYIASDPRKVHKRVLLGPSDIGKTTLAVHMALVNERDNKFNEQLRTVTGDSDQKFLGIHLSLSHVLEEVAYYYQLPNKRDIREEHRPYASELILQAVSAAEYALTNAPGYTVGFYIDVVGMTESNLGRTAVQRLRHYNNTRYFLPEPNAIAEDKGRTVRSYATQPTKEEPLDNILVREGIKAGTALQGREHEFALSSGDENAWRRHWTDIYQQIVTKYPSMAAMYLHSTPDIETFLSSQEARFMVYKEFLPERMKELGLPIDDERVAWVPNSEELDEVHIHFNRLYGKPDKHDPETTRHRFPLQLLRQNKRLNEYTFKDFATVMGL